MASSALPETLRSVTSTKIQELKKQRDQYEASKRHILDDAKPCANGLERTQKLLNGTCRQAGVRVLDDDSSDSDSLGSSNNARKLRNQQLFLRQARKDPAFASDIVHQIHDELIEDLELKSIQHEHAQFFSELVTEWLSASKNSDSAQIKDGLGDSSFESVGRKEMHEQREQWESLVFSPSKIGESEIKVYLNRLFKSDKTVATAFKEIEEATKHHCETLRNIENFFDSSDLTTTIKGVLKTDLLTEEKAAILRSFQNNQDVLQEVVDVLNMRFASLETWKWTTINGAITVDQRRQLNGKYRVFMDEDVLDALFLHAIGMKWAVHFKSCLTTFFKSYAWKSAARSVAKADQNRRRYFLGEEAAPSGTLESRRREDYEKDYFMTQLPVDESEGTRGYDSDEETGSPRKNPVETKQALLHLLITEALIARHLRPGSSHAVIRSDFQWFGPSLPHGTIFTVLEFFGVNSEWLDFFRIFLQAPMRFKQDGADGQFQVRQRGVPMSHALSDVFGEVILFVMDFAVNDATQSYLYRLHDDFWFWGSEHLCALGWEAMTKFAAVMGIEFNQEKTGTVVFDQGPVSQQTNESSEDSDRDFGDESRSSSKPRLPTGDVRWGFLRLDAHSFRFMIDQQMVNEHIEELQRQLSHCPSIFSYVQAYNAYLARFFSNNFGKPSYAFGRGHIDDMIDTFARIQKIVFPGGSVTDYLAKVAEERFKVKDIPDGVWYWPVQMGGLELRNPLVSLYCMRETMRRSPEKILTRYLEADENSYVGAKAKFEQEVKLHTRRLSYPSSLPTYGEVFMTKDEFLRYREQRSVNLRQAYEDLLAVPTEFNVRVTNKISAWLDKLPPRARGSRSASSGIDKTFRSMKPYWKWILAVYGEQIVEKYGSVQIVDAAQVPLGVVSIMKAGKVRWQG